MDDVLADLERLTRLRDAGALTEEEFAAQKARLLAGPAGAGAGAAAFPTHCAGCGAPLQLDAAGRCAYCHELQPGAMAAGAARAAPGSSDAMDDAIARANPKNKIMAIKQLREQAGLSLKDAKDRIDAAFVRLGL